MAAPLSGDERREVAADIRRANDYYYALRESCYARALEAVATGLTYDETRNDLGHLFPSLLPRDIRAEMRQAYKDAEPNGIEPEDIDQSWRRRAL